MSVVTLVNVALALEKDYPNQCKLSLIDLSMFLKLKKKCTKTKNAGPESNIKRLEGIN